MIANGDLLVEKSGIRTRPRRTRIPPADCSHRRCFTSHGLAITVRPAKGCSAAFFIHRSMGVSALQHRTMPTIPSPMTRSSPSPSTEQQHTLHTASGACSCNGWPIHNEAFHGPTLNVITPLHKMTKRDYLARMVDDKVHCMLKAKEYEADYWDGDRRYGYGGYRYEGRWKPVAQSARSIIYGLKPRCRDSRRRVRQGVPAARAQAAPARCRGRRLRHFAARTGRCPRGGPPASVPLPGAGSVSVRRQALRSRHLARLPAQPADLRARRPRCRKSSAWARTNTSWSRATGTSSSSSTWNAGRSRPRRSSIPPSGSGCTSTSATPATTSSSTSSTAHADHESQAQFSSSSAKPLVVDDIDCPMSLDVVGQVLVKVLYTSICGAQINEIDGAKGPDKFLPHLLGHEALRPRARDRPRACDRDDRRPVVMHWRPSDGYPMRCRRATRGMARSSTPAG